jgi:hypothetical protein
MAVRRTRGSLMANVVAVQQADYGTLADFLATFPGETRSQGYWLRRFTYWWDTNPACLEGMARGWILEDNHTYVGFLGVIPLQFKVDDTMLTAYHSTTWRVLDTHRNESLKLILKQLQIAHNTLLFNTTPNDKVEKIVQFLKFSRLPREVPDYSKKYVVILNNHRKLIATKLGDNMYSTMISHMLSPPLKMFSNYFMNKKLTKKGLYDVRTLSKADSQFDNLWHKTSHIYKNTNVRVSEVINWDCFSNSDHKKCLVGCYEDDTLKGYAIFRHIQRRDLQIMECLDIWGDMVHIERILGSLLYFILNSNIRDTFDVVSFSGFNKPILDFFETTRMLPMAVDDRKEYVNIPKNMDRTPITATNSYFTNLQGDYAY